MKAPIPLSLLGLTLLAVPPVLSGAPWSVDAKSELAAAHAKVKAARAELEQRIGDLLTDRRSSYEACGRRLAAGESVLDVVARIVELLPGIAGAKPR